MIQKILCVGKRDTARAPMLAAFLRRTISETEGLRPIAIESAGTFCHIPLECAGSPAEPNAVACMKEYEIDISNHKSRSLSAVPINNFDLIICLDREAFSLVAAHFPCGAILLAVPLLNDGFIDPFQKKLQDYQLCARVLEEVAEAIVRTFLN